MLHGIWALLERSLRFDVRNRWSHAFRVAALLAGYWAMWMAAESSPWFGAPGLRFFQMLVIVNGWLIAAAGLSYFASAITEEKDEGTLGLMLMTGLSPLGILLGKSGSRLVQAALLVLLQIPFALLAVTLGGVTPNQVYATYAALLSFLFFVANVALLCSVLAPNTRSASLWMVLASVAYPLVFWACYEIARNNGIAFGPAFRGGHWAATIVECSFFYRVGTLLETGWQFRVIDRHEIVHVAAGLVCFVLAWRLFPWATRQPDADPLSRGLLGMRIGGQWRLAPGRVWDAAIAWKEFHFLIGGWPLLALKSAGYVSLVTFLWWYWHGTTGYWNRSPQHDPAIQSSIMFVSLLLALEAAVLSSRVFSDEVRGQTLGLWTLMPESLGILAYRKVVTSFVGLIPVGGMLFLLLFFTQTGRWGLGDAIGEPMFWAVCSLFVVIVHFSAFYSLYVRWGAIPLAIATVVVPFALFLMMMEAGRFRPDEDGMGVFICLISMTACGALHPLIGARLRELAAQ